MYIEEMKIENFRGIKEIEIKKLTKYLQVIGDNDSGKSTIFAAIKKVLSYDFRKIDLTKEDSFQENCNDIKIKIILNCENVIKNREKYPQKFISCMDNIIMGDKIEIKLLATYQGNGIYNEEYTIKDSTYPNRYIKNLDEIINLVYQEPHYNLEEKFKEIVKKNKLLFEKNEIDMNTSSIDVSLTDFNNEIKKNTFVKNTQNIINKNMDYKFLQGLQYEITSDINPKNYWSSLYLKPQDDHINVNDFGDGNKRIISTNLNIAKAELDIEQKSIILLLEEPENNLFISSQRTYIDEIIKNENISQVLINTHSPNIIKNNPEFSILKMRDKNFEMSKPVENDFGYFYSSKFAEMFYYDIILCVEGYSEEIFYDYLTKISPEFKEFIIRNKIGIFNVKGIGFEKYINVFKELGIKVLIKTDNDLIKARGTDEFNFSGLNRGLKYLDDQSKEEIKRIEFENLEFENNIKIKTKNSKNTAIDDIYIEDIKKIINILNKNGIYLSIHSDGFEKDLKELFNDFGYRNIIDIESLKKAKAENLYYCLKNEVNLELKNIFNKIFENLENLENKKSENTLIKFIYDIRSENAKEENEEHK